MQVKKPINPIVRELMGLLVVTFNLQLSYVYYVFLIFLVSDLSFSQPVAKKP